MHITNQIEAKTINHLNRHITSDETEAVIKSLPTKKSPGPDGFKAELYQTFREELIPIFLKLFQERKGRNTTNSFYEDSIILIPNPIKMQQKKRIIDQYL
jgi:hypothetical protein